ncbi:MAG: hypothetical protein K1X33_08485 [Methanobacteriaceae archaeon]|nr:hypothetical protein [Methanobacteriaceae archaeon]
MPTEQDKSKKDEVNRKWKLNEKTRMNISIPNDLANWLDDNASKNWKLDKAARSKQMTCILMEARKIEAKKAKDKIAEEEEFYE